MVLGRGHGPPTVTSSVLRPFGVKKRKKFRRSQRKPATSDRHSVTSCPVVSRHFKPGDRVVVETVCTKTNAQVVWQVTNLSLSTIYTSDRVVLNVAIVVCDGSPN